jgi:hypothetical protein
LAPGVLTSVRRLAGNSGRPPERSSQPGLRLATGLNDGGHASVTSILTQMATAMG